MMPASNFGLGLNCPGDLGCPGYVAPGSDAYTQSLLEEVLANQTAGGATVGVPVYVSSGFDWSSIPVWACGAGAFAIALVLFAGGRRR